MPEDIPPPLAERCAVARDLSALPGLATASVSVEASYRDGRLETESSRPDILVAVAWGADPGAELRAAAALRAECPDGLSVAWAQQRAHIRARARGIRIVMVLGEAASYLMRQADAAADASLARQVGA